MYTLSIKVILALKRFDLFLHVWWHVYPPLLSEFVGSPVMVISTWYIFDIENDIDIINLFFIDISIYRVSRGFLVFHLCLTAY